MSGLDGQQSSLWETSGAPMESTDEGVAAVSAFLRRGRSEGELENLLGRCVREAIDQVIDGPRTGRWSVPELEKTEKTYIGTRVEILVRDELGLARGGMLDTEIAGYPVDIKFSISSKWQIPSEAVGEICLVLGTDKKVRNFTAGLVRCNEDALNTGRNKDGKRTLSRKGWATIQWLVKSAPLPSDFLSSLPPGIREKIEAHRSGQGRVRELFRLWPEQPVPRLAIEVIARQKDPMRRVRRDATDRLDGLVVLSGRYERHREAARRLNLPPLMPDEFMSVSAEKITGSELGGTDE